MEIIYTLCNQKQTKRALVQVSEQKEIWSNPKVINISGEYQDVEPFYANNGDRLFFASNRPLSGESEAGDYNLWYSDCAEKNGATQLHWGLALTQMEMNSILL